MNCNVLEDMDVSRETCQDLSIYVDLVKKWNPKINLVSRKSLHEIWSRHVKDSVQVFRCAPKFKDWADLGSGGGFPGIVCAIMAKTEAPDAKFTLVESDQRKSVFLRTAIRECKINCSVSSCRIEEINPLDADIISARALADLKVLLSLCNRHMGKNGSALLPKGASWKKELTEAQEEWKFEVEPITSLTEPQAVILKIRGISRG